MEAGKTKSTEKGHETTIEVKNKMGVHARPAAMIVRVANRYKADIYFEKDDEVVDGKSIMGLMMLAAGQGSKLRVSANGADAKDACKALEELFENKFEES